MSRQSLWALPLSQFRFGKDIPLTIVESLMTSLCRPSLMKYHTQLLTLTGDGSGSWILSRLGTAEERMGIDREILSLENNLAEVNDWERRVKELDRLLAAQESG
jgi:ATP-binding cassette, subfamily D (ALD), peroxisomal long-chain fatty acid import protein